MKLLVVTFEMDPESRVLAWQLKVVSEFARTCEKVIVLTERLGAWDPPNDMEVHTVPRLFQTPLRWAGAKWLMNLYVFLLCMRYRFDVCFVHMNMEWTYRLYPCFLLFKLPVLMWYAHGTVSQRLHLAHWCATRVVTSSREGFRIPSEKVRVIGQGVDTSLFTIQEPKHPQLDIVTVGRLSLRKRVHLLIDVMECLRQKQPEMNFRLRLIGCALTDRDRKYEKNLKDFVAAKKLGCSVDFVGHVPIDSVPEYYRSAFLHLNVSETGSMDKAILEALACGCQVLTSNEAFRSVLRDHPEFVVFRDTPEAIAEQILRLYRAKSGVDQQALRRLVVGRHDLPTYVQKVLAELSELAAERFTQ